MISPHQQDALLFDNEEGNTFFTPTHNRITNFAREFMKVPKISDDPVVFAFENSGDLIGESVIRLQVTSEGPIAAEDFVEAVALRIGGMTVDRHTREYFRVFDAFHRTLDKKEAFKRASRCDGGESRDVWLPLLFCSSRHPSRSLPIVALSKEAVEIEVELSNVPGARVEECELWADMIYVGEPERVRLSSTPHLYALETAQTNVFDLPENATVFNARLNFAGPIKCIYFTFPDKHLLMTASLAIEGVQRFGNMPASWWNHWAQSGFEGCPPPGYYAMPLCLRPDSLQPTGSMNCSMVSRIDLRVVLTAPAPPDAELHVFGVGYNFLAIRDGVGRLLCGEVT